MCAEIVPEWEFQDERKWGKGFGRYIRDDRGHVDIWNDLNTAARLVEAFVGENYKRENYKREKLYEQAVHRQIAGELGGYISTYRMMRATPREQALAVLSAYKGEMVEVEDEASP